MLRTKPPALFAQLPFTKLTVDEGIRQEVGATTEEDEHLAGGQRVRLVAELEERLGESERIGRRAYDGLRC